MSKKQTVTSFIRRHRVFLGVLVGIMILWGVAAVATWNYFEDSTARTVAAQRADSRRADELIRRLEAKKIAERKSAEEARQKELAEAEAAKKKAEEEARNAAPKPAVTPSTSAPGSGCGAATAHSNPAAITVLVNKKHCLQPLSFTPPDLVTTHGATISAKAAADFNRMFADAAASGQPFTVSSSYRSYATQVSTYNYWVSVNGQQAADTVSARPGYSEHQTGFAVDVAANGCTLNCFGGTSQYQWFQANAANYGFIQRYYAGYESITGYASEEWHYRYVGVPVAQDMKARGIKTLEQYWGLPGGGYN